MEDMQLTCAQCGRPFVFTVSQQERFRELGFDDPKRCPECRKKRSSLRRMRKRDPEARQYNRKDYTFRRRGHNDRFGSEEERNG